MDVFKIKTLPLKNFFYFSLNCSESVDYTETCMKNASDIWVDLGIFPS